MPYKIPKKVLEHVKNRDKFCVYCKKNFDNSLIALRSNKASIEHLNYKHEWDSVGSYLKENKPVSKIIVICCGACNSSRRDKPLKKWFLKEYCVKRKINFDTVSKEVRKFMLNYESDLD
jgi:hypothetical protein